MIYRKYKKAYYVFKAINLNSSRLMPTMKVWNLDSNGKLNRWNVLYNHLGME